MKAKTFLIAIPWLILLASAAWGLGVGGSGRVRTSTPYTFTATQTAPEWASSSADNTHYLNVNNSTSHKSNPSTGDIDTIAGLPWIYNGSWVRILVTGDGSSGYTTAPTYSDDTCTVGQWSTSSGYLYNCTATNTWTRTSLTTWNNPHSAPTLSSATIGTNGTTLTFAMSESVSVGAGGNGGFDVDCVTAGNNITATYSSGAPGSSLVYTLGTTVNGSDTCDLDYTQPGNGIEATTGGADLASITSASVTNNSTQSSGAAYTDSFATISGYWSTMTSSYALTSHSTYATGSQDGDRSYNYYNRTITANQYSTVTLASGSLAMYNSAIFVRGSADGHRYEARSDGTTIYIKKCTALGTCSDLTSAAYEAPSEATVKLSVNSSNLITFYSNGSSVVSYTDSSSPITTGYPGIAPYGQGIEMHNWQGGDL